MKIFDQSVSRETALKLKEFVDEAIAICTQKSMLESGATLQLSMPQLGQSASIPVPPQKQEGEKQEYQHYGCSGHAYGVFGAMVDKYANGNSASTVLTDPELLVVKTLNDPEIAIEKAPDAFLLLGKPVEVFAKTDDVKSAARETAWKDLKMIADVFAVYARRGCQGSQRTSEEVSAHITKALEELTATNAGKNLQEGRDFERLSL